MTNYYKILGVSEEATAEEIKAAFKKQAVKYHPDKHPGDPSMEERFKEINHAHQILSDPYEKARYDVKLKYRQFTNTNRAYTYSNRPRYRRAAYSPPSVDYKQNAIATLYAFGITLVIALIVMMGLWIKEGYDERKLERLLSERREVYKAARLSYDSGDYEQAFNLMSNFHFFRREERDMKLFRDNMVDDIISKGDQSFDQQHYEEAIYLYELVQKFEPKKPLFAVKTHLAEAYLKTNRPDKSIAIYEDLMMKEYRIIKSLIEIAEIHRDRMGNLQAAREYYLDAHKMAVKQYKNFYGEGYSLVINERYVPSEHYELYTGLADIYYRLEDYELALKASLWNKYVWPDSVDAFLISANTYLAQGKNDEACLEYREAKNRGWRGETAIRCY